VKQDKLVKFGKENCLYLERYMTLFNQRIKPRFRRYRETLIFEFKEIEVRGLSYKGRNIIAGNEKIPLKVIFSIDKIGCGCLTYWMKIRTKNPIDDARALRDLYNLKTKVNLQVVNYSGELSFYAFIKLLICVILKRIYHNKLRPIDINRILVKKGNIDIIHRKMCRLISPKLELYTEVEPYPVFFIEMDINTEELREFKSSCSKEIRAILTGDLHWMRKKDSIVKKQVFEQDKSSTDSVIWIIDTDGTVKIYSDDFQTDRLLSKLMSVFELEILLMQKFFLHHINYNLSKISNEEWSPSELSEFRDTCIRKMNEYYNIDISKKDTTRYRIEACKEVLNINYLYKVAIARFDALSAKIRDRYEAQIMRREFWLILIFGVLGVGTLTFDLLNGYLGTEYYPLTVCLTFISILITFILIFIIFFDS